MRDGRRLPVVAEKPFFSRRTRRPAAAMWRFAFLALLLAAQAVGCFSSTPEKAVRDFIDARAAGNDRRAAVLTVEGDLSDYPGGEPYLGDSDITFQVGEVVVDGDRALVTVNFQWDGQEVGVPYVARRIESKWKVALAETREEWLPSPEVESPSQGG